MDSRIVKAIAWKESRQMAGVVIGFVLLTVLYMLQLFFQHKSTGLSLVKVKESLILGAFIGTACLSYLLSAGNRVMEASQNLESYLFVRPVPRFDLFKTYFACGCCGWLAWALSFLLLQGILFGVRPTLFEGQDPLGAQYLRIFFVFLVVYTLTYCVALLSPKLTITVLTSVISFILVTAASDVTYKKIAEVLQRMVEILLSIIPVVMLLALLALFLTLTLILYQHKQVD